MLCYIQLATVKWSHLYSYMSQLLLLIMVLQGSSDSKEESQHLYSYSISQPTAATPLIWALHKNKCSLMIFCVCTDASSYGRCVLVATVVEKKQTIIYSRRLSREFYISHSYIASLQPLSNDAHICIIIHEPNTYFIYLFALLVLQCNGLRHVQELAIQLKRQFTIFTQAFLCQSIATYSGSQSGMEMIL